MQLEVSKCCLWECLKWIRKTKPYLCSMNAAFLTPLPFVSPSGSSMSMGRSSVLFGRSWHFRVVGENVCVCARDRGSKAECVWECQSRARRCFANWTFFCGSVRSVGSWGRTHPALILELQQKRRALQPPLALCKINGRVRPRDCLSVREKSQKGNETILHELPWEKNEWPDFWLHTGDSLVKWSRRVWKWN